MSRINTILLGLAAFCTTTFSFGQQDAKPAYCIKPNDGTGVDKISFTLTTQYGCLNFTTNQVTTEAINPISQSGAALNDLGYIFNFKDGDPTPPNYPRPVLTKTTVTAPGIYWILQGANVNSEANITCKSFEVIKTEQPDFEISNCGDRKVTVKFLDTPKNRKHGKYRIIWGDGGPNGQTFSAPITVWPVEFSHDYAATPSVLPQIEAIYTRGGSNAEACKSAAISFPVGINSTPRISELEGLSGGSSDKITMVEGLDGKEYTIEQKPKNGSWTDTGKKIMRASAATSASETITGLNPANEYCFRLKTTDACANVTMSNEVCTIIPKATIITSKIVKIDWNAPDPNVTRYSIGYKESPSGANPNTASPVTPTATTYTFDALDCKKKYDFNVTAFIGTTPANRVVIKSPNVLVDPSQTPKLAPKTIGTVSVLNNSVIKFNIYEANQKASKYIYYRSEGGPNNFVKVKEYTENFYDDKNVEPDKQQYCYKVEYQDECGNSSEPSPSFCSVFLTSTQANTLNWTPFVIPTPDTFPVEYYVEAFDPNGMPQTVNVTGDNTLGVKAQIDRILDDPNAFGKANFRIRAVQRVKLDINGSLISFPFDVYSNIYTFITPAQIYIPTAFSPNNDGNNDIFVAKGRFIVEFNLVVYDRWGNVIFESKDLETGWNGTANDGVTPAPPGNYGFKIYGLDPAGQAFEKVGSVTLIR